MIEFMLVEDGTDKVLPSEFTLKNNELSIFKEAEDIKESTTYSVRFMFYFEKEISEAKYSEPFNVHVVSLCFPPPDCHMLDNCGVPPPTVVPPKKEEFGLVYTISTRVATIELPAWRCGTDGCDAKPDVNCVDCLIDGQEGLVSVVDNKFDIYIDECGTLCKDEVDQTQPGTFHQDTRHTIKLEGCIGDVCETITVPVKLLNPCLDKNLLSIKKVNVDEAPEYKIT